MLNREYAVNALRLPLLSTELMMSSGITLKDKYTKCYALVTSMDIPGQQQLLVLDTQVMFGLYKMFRLHKVI